ncbi:MAG: hypothetical protein ACOYJF_00305 [Prevotella sp.]|jgi:hypothetical protein
MTRKTFIFGTALLTAMIVVGSCGNPNKKKSETAKTSDSQINTVTDSTVYGICGEGTSMNSLELITDGGDTLHYIIEEGIDGRQPVQGGLLAGDRMAVVGTKSDGELVANKVINLTSLQGKWTSLDKNFEIEEGGTIRSFVKAESHPWTSWKILNGQLLLNTDTFDINELGEDSLYLENKEGIFVYKRQH